MSATEIESWVRRSLANRKLQQGSDFDLLSRLSVIIPSYGRSEFLLRQIVYWGYTRADIIILDGSPSPLAASILNVLDQVPNIRYIHAKENFVDRLKIAAALIQTPYAITLPDDEFYLKGALCSAIAVLDQDVTLAACNGQVLGINYLKSEQRVSYHDAAYAFWKYSRLEDNPADRLNRAMSTYNAVACYAVLRKNVWISGWGGMHAWSSPYAGEIFQAMTTYLHGKLTTIDEIYMLRSSENDPVSLERSFDRKLSFGEWWYEPQFSVDREDFTSCLTDVAVNCLGVERQVARSMIENSVVVYLAYCREREKGAKLKAVRNSVRAGISATLRNCLSPRKRQTIKRVVAKSIRAATQDRQPVLYDWQLVSRSSNDPNNQIEIQGVEELVSEFYAAMYAERGNK